MTKLNTSLNKYFSGITLMIFFVLGMMSQSIAQENTADHKETLKEEVVAISHEAHEAEEEFKMQDMIFNHINNSNEFHLFG
ncbi:MAG: hypothetical protein WAU12_13965, partial [Saprospiraceae bacterium]